MKGIKSLGWALLAASAALISVASLRYFTLRPNLVAPILRDTFQDHLPWLLAHVGAGSISLLLGPWQFVERLRLRYTQWHQRIGWAYACAVAIGSLAGLRLALISSGGLPAH